jgi:hypothetical protein
MTQQLHDELARIGDAAPRVAPSPDLAPDLWRRGRRARTRDRLVAAGAVLALVLGLGGLTTAVMGGPAELLPASPASDDPGVPSMLYAVPGHVQKQDNDQRFTGPLTPTSELGPGALAFVTGDGVPVLVDAESGEYHLLDLPGWRGGDVLVGMLIDASDSQPLAISPDGRQLAWAWAEPGGRTDTATIATGVRVLDLESGDMRTAVITSPGRATLSGQGVLVRTLAWSPDSRWLAWSGLTVQEWNAGGIGGYSPSPLAGRIGPGSTRPGIQWATDRSTSVTGTAISDDGTLLVTQQDGWVMRYQATSPQDRSFSVGRVLNPAPAGAMSPDGSMLAIGSYARETSMDLADLEGVRLAPRALSPDVYPDGAFVRPLGWLDDDTVVVLARTEGDGDLGRSHIAVMSAPTVPEEKWTYRIVTRSEPTNDAAGVASFHSVAVDLMTPEHLTVDRSEPDWPWSIERRATVGVVSGVAVVGVWVFLWSRRRRW